MKRRIISVIWILASISLSALAADRPTDRQIRALVEANMEAAQTKDLAAYVKTIHPDSPSQPSLASEIEALSAYDLEFRIRSVRFVAMSGEYALARVVQETIRRSGPDFLDNELDGIWALRRSGSEWKYWSQLVLELRPLGPAATQ
jgi:hypothetical protein